MTATLPLTVDYGHIELATVHFDELDAMGVLHNARYPLLLERAMTAFWGREGHTFVNGRPQTTDTFNVVREFQITYLAPIRDLGQVVVHFWTERVGQTSAIYGFRLLSADLATVYAQGRRVHVKIDQKTGAPSPWSVEGRAIAESLLRPAE